MPEFAQEPAPDKPYFVEPVLHTDFLPFAPPTLGEEENAEVVDTLRSGWLSTDPKTKRFEQEFSGALGAETGLALSSCTADLHLALSVLDIESGDEAITTPYTFCATANTIEHVGAKTVLADVEPDTLDIDPAAVEAAITGRTRAIMVVHLAGHPVYLDEIRAIAGRRGIPSIQDAAHSLSASYRGEAIASHTDFTAFSFYATKNLTTAEGGMLVGDSGLVEKARVLSLHGMSRGSWRRYARSGNWYHEIVEPGFKHNIMDIQAAA
jgi:dTDP-4-amino-4,6-dideoxygalactose transaminase